MRDLDQFFYELEEATSEGRRKDIRRMLAELMRERRAFYEQCTTISHLESFSQAMFHALILELDDEEEDSIEGAELCYVAIGSIMKSVESEEEGRMYDVAKRRLLLLHYFYDYLTDAITALFMPENREKKRLEARNIAVDCLERMQLHDLSWLAEHFPELAEHDEQITVCDRSLSTLATELSKSHENDDEDEEEDEDHPHECSCGHDHGHNHTHAHDHAGGHSEGHTCNCDHDHAGGHAHNHCHHGNAPAVENELSKAVEEASVMHKALTAYLRVKYKKRENP